MNMRITFQGTVQGVGFRPAVYRTATELGLSGKVWNDGSDVIVEVDDGDLFLNVFLNNLPTLAHVENISKEDSEVLGNKGFTIVDSKSGFPGVSIPTDITICQDCLNDLKESRRKGYPFVSCTNCGPRFTLLYGLPYDRKMTAMRSFGPCAKCSNEYNDPNNRRFHHQTICCNECGPSYRLVDKSGTLISGDPVKNFTNALKEGKMGVVKSWGGMHICCTLDHIGKMRKWYRRGQKPFAIMVRDIESVRKYGIPNTLEVENITSPHRPIVLIEKKDSDITELISPGLNNIGIFLPYTGIQHLIFEHLDEDALVMTSANVPGEPMILDDDSIMELGADVYLLHDQPIINRADDSVLRIFDDNISFIRRSRGHVPSFISVNMKGSAVAVGAQENLTGSVAVNGRIHPTQHIGNGEGIGVVEYLEESIRSQMELLDCKPQAVALDLHPRYINRNLGKRLSSEFGSEMIEVQHHWAHAASLIIDNDVSDVVALALDGSGHGDDGTVWGGEVLMSDLSSFNRVGHLESIPLLGSEKALYDLRRLKFAIDSMNGEENHSFNESEATILTKMMNTSVKCSSMGRLMDALSYSLGICSSRTYDGEPAMKLEPLLATGELIPGFETSSKNGIVNTVELFSRIKRDQNPSDVAYSVIYNVMKELVACAIESADLEGIRNIGITGGVSYNSPICKMFTELAKDSGHGLIFHNNIPNGDGGISLGQAAIALRKIQ